MNTFPLWLLKSVITSFLGNITPSMRAITVGFTWTKKLKIRYYLSEEISDIDRDSMELVEVEIEAVDPFGQKISGIITEYEVSQAPVGRLECFDMWLFVRYE
jgi:hypothetical protein